MLDRWLRPDLAPVVRPDGLLDLDEPVAHREAVRHVHEIGIAGPSGRDDRLAEPHRIGDRQTDAFGSMKRDVRVAAGDEAADAIGRDIARVDVNRGTRGALGQRREA